MREGGRERGWEGEREGGRMTDITVEDMAYIGCSLKDGVIFVEIFIKFKNGGYITTPTCTYEWRRRESQHTPFPSHTHTHTHTHR